MVTLNRQLAESGAHVVMAVRNTKAANELIQKWQNEWSGMGLPLNIEVTYSGYQLICQITYCETLSCSSINTLVSLLNILVKAG